MNEQFQRKSFILQGFQENTVSKQTLFLLLEEKDKNNKNKINPSVLKKTVKTNYIKIYIHFSQEKVAFNNSTWKAEAGGL